jgi:hypothetical protein
MGSVVRSMTEFAHPDSRTKADVDLNRAIRTTLNMARNEYKAVAELETDFGDIPTVTATRATSTRWCSTRAQRRPRDQRRCVGHQRQGPHRREHAPHSAATSRSRSATPAPAFPKTCAAASSNHS